MEIPWKYMGYMGKYMEYMENHGKVYGVYMENTMESVGKCMEYMEIHHGIYGKDYGK